MGQRNGIQVNKIVEKICFVPKIWTSEKLEEN